MQYTNHIHFSPKETFVLHEQLDKITGLRVCDWVTQICVCVCDGHHLLVPVREKYFGANKPVVWLQDSHCTCNDHERDKLFPM